jgi:hypothetical protein
LNIPVKDFAYYDVKTSKWVVEPGKYKPLAGLSSRSIEQSCTTKSKLNRLFYLVLKQRHYGKIMPFTIYTILI